jgi:hypothetical protein
MDDSVKIEPEDLAAFIAEKWSDTAFCRMCGHDQFGVGGVSALKVMVAIGGDDLPEPRQAKHSLPLYPVLCSNCGAVEFVVQGAVLHWKATRS